MDEVVLERAKGLVRTGRRALLGIAGPPGAGKSTLAAALTEQLRAQGVHTATVPMDGFHLTQAELVARGLRDVMGRIDTFDADGYRAMLRRLRDQHDQAIRAPDFDRRIEEPVPDAIVIEPSVELVVTDGNYLLDATPPWPEIRSTLDEVWFVETTEEARLERLHARHVTFGKTDDEARRWIERVDDPNARRIVASRDKADLVVDLS